MSNREALRRLSRKYPTPPEIERLLEGLRDSADMLAAITATAILEAALEKLISAKFKAKREALIGQIFLNRGPLSDFHSKILIANAFGIITSRMAEELHSLKAVRNVFAHAKVEISFDHELIKREVDSSGMLNAMRAVEKTAGSKLDLTNKQWFLLVAKLLLVVIDGLEKHPGTADDAIKAWESEKPSPSS